MMKDLLSLQISWSVVAYFRRKAVETSMKASECDSKAKRIIVLEKNMFEYEQHESPSKHFPDKLNFMKDSLDFILKTE